MEEELTKNNRTSSQKKLKTYIGYTTLRRNSTILLNTKEELGNYLNLPNSFMRTLHLIHFIILIGLKV